VPTGNFGDIFAGYIAKQMGLPIDNLIIATNKNDILARCLNTGTYGMTGVEPTISPSMDIQISSNFERLLFDLYGRSGSEIANLMKNFRADKTFTLTPQAHKLLQRDFSACSVDDAETKKTIKSMFESTGELLDPHTAVGVASAYKVRPDTGSPVIVLATAHPAKFPDAVKEASGQNPQLPPHMQDLFSKPERFEVMENDAAGIKAFINKTV
jgi:threonine synthase